MHLSEKYWDTRYKNKDIGWDLGEVSPPLKEYFDQLTNKSLKILIPGCGNSYEAEYLYQHGFTQVYVADVSKTALSNINKRVPAFPKANLIHQNFFDINMSFDLIIEQTFFCAILPELRANYARKAHSLLNPNGKIVGLLFNFPLNSDKPPFGGDKNEYLNYFEPYFNIEVMESCYNSTITRAEKELFINLKKYNL